jgi:uncharacterized phage protein (TIGR01671 family)
MREIKFKIWSEIDKKFLENTHYIDNNWLIHFSACKWPLIAYENQEKYKIVQYTWLKDKNWKEIYEGDVMQYKCKYPISHQNTMPWKKYNRISNWVIYSEKWACFLIDTTFENEEIFLWFETKNQWEIIWNIYENKEQV